MRHSTARGLLTVPLAATLALALAAQAPSQRPDTPPDPQPPRFRTEANFVRVDVYPTSGGRPVLDLRREDFEILEDGAPQAIDSFEFVQVRPAGPQSARVEPGSVQAGEQMASNPRSRVFVVFLDVPHVSILGAHAVNEPLIRLLDRVLAPEDLVGVMTTSMSTAQLTLGRKTEVLARGLRENWPWGQRSRLVPMDTREEMYEDCYSRYVNGPPLIKKMVARRREVLTLEALEDLVRYLRGIRDERKAILTISEGWTLYRQDPQMMEPLYVMVGLQKVFEEPPGTERIGVGPGGKLTREKQWNEPFSGTKYECDTDRRQLSDIDNDEFFRRLLNTANRANASFYAVDPRGLPASDNEIAADVPPAIDRAHLRGRLTTLQTLAESTDGLAIFDNNDLEQSLQRVAADLTSYYLLGYYSSNAKLDGRYRRISVRVKRPGVDVRARRGYLAPTEAEVNAARRAAAPAPATVSGVDTALGALSRIRPDAKLFVNASAQPGASSVWVAGELGFVPGDRSWAAGGTADITVMSGGTSEMARVTLAPGERAFVTQVPMRVTAPAQLDVRVRVTAADGGAPPATEIIRVEVASGAVQPLLFRRGAATANRWRPAGDFRFSRTERLRVDVPAGTDAKASGGRLRDRSGHALAVPVTVSERVDDGTGQKWITGEIALAPLAPGDYVVELVTNASTGEEKTLTAVRVTR